jgi:hypothetical protein
MWNKILEVISKSISFILVLAFMGGIAVLVFFDVLFEATKEFFCGHREV